MPGFHVESTTPQGNRFIGHPFRGWTAQWGGPASYVGGGLLASTVDRPGSFCPGAGRVD